MSALILRSGSLQASQLDYWLVDGSGSMQDKWWQTLATMDQFSEVLKSQNIHSHGIVTVFDDSNLQMIQRDSVISDWRTFSDDPLGSNFGGTPLYDAINLMGRHLRDLDPPKASIVIVTDGDETSSTHTTAAQARAILDWCRAKGWQVTFLGADFNNARQARLLGATDRNSLGVTSARLSDAGKLLGEKRVRHARTDADISFTDDEKSEFGGYLNDLRS
jgi:hypothetical protein